jgi:hypothetical protein
LRYKVFSPLYISRVTKVIIAPGPRSICWCTNKLNMRAVASLSSAPCCAFISASEDNLQDHMAAEHSGERFSCKKCPYKAKRKTSLLHHVLAKGKGKLFHGREGKRRKRRKAS